MNTGEQIGADIAAVETFVEPFLSSAPSPVTSGVLIGLKLLAAAEPAVYNAISAAISGTALTPEQEQARDAAIARLQNPAQYFA